MIAALIRLLSIQFCTFYTFTKLLNIKNSYMLSKLLIIIAVTIISYYVGSIFTAFTIPLMILITIGYLISSKEVSLNTRIITAIIAYGVSFCIYLIANFTSSITRLLIINISAELCSIITLIVQSLIIVLLFRIKRLRRGMPFLKNIVGTDSGVVINILLLNSIILLFNNNYNYIYLLPTFIVITSGGLIYLWWRKSLTKLYISNTKDTEINNLKEILEEKEQRILYLEQQNSELAKIIHTDNKLVSSLDFAVKSLFEILGSSDDLEDIRARGRDLLAHVEEVTQDRFGIINAHRLLNKSLPKTRVTSIDILLSYMLNKASSAGITFDVNIMGSIKYMTDSIITDKDLTVLLAELIDNAIIAVKQSEIKRVLVTLGIADNNYVVYVFDSGGPFAPEVLSNFGKRQITTHREEGGSGIGLMTISEIVNKYKASLDIINLPSGSLYTKQIAICFSNKGV
jgi:hypothetical protein